MQLLYQLTDGRRIYQLDPAEVTQLEKIEVGVNWPNEFLRQLAALPLTESTYNAIARAAHAYPDFFVDQQGNCVTLATWARMVLTSEWKAPGVGPLRVREVREALATVVAA